MKSSDRAYAALKGEILDGDLLPGQTLGETEQAVRLGVSRTPVREALNRLESEGLVAPGSGRRMTVTAVSAAQVKALFEVRVALECQAVRLAAVRRDSDQFEELRGQFQRIESGDVADAGKRAEYYQLASGLDDAIDRAMDNPYLLAPLHNVRTHIERARRLSRNEPARLKQAAGEHLIIIDAILDGEPEVAASATQVHLHRSLRSILESVDAMNSASTDRLSA